MTSVNVAAKPGEPRLHTDDWYIWKKKDEPKWTPYCGVCPTIDRMQDREYGYQCMKCMNKIGFDCLRYKDLVVVCEGVESSSGNVETSLNSASGNAAQVNSGPSDADSWVDFDENIAQGVPDENSLDDFEHDDGGFF